MRSNLGDSCNEVRSPCEPCREPSLVLETDRVRLLGSGDGGSTPVCSAAENSHVGGKETLQLARQLLPLPSAAPKWQAGVCGDPGNSQ